MLKIRLKPEESLPIPGKQEDPVLPRAGALPHLCAEKLPEARGAGNVSRGAEVEILGYAVHRRNGEKVHICVRCNFPIAIYGRLHPCDHIFCFTCATKDSKCYLCDAEISRVKKIDFLDGVFICGASRCLKSFLDRQAFEFHISEQHKDLLTKQEPVQQHQEKPVFEEKKPQTIERQSRQQQFRNAQQQRQMDQLKHKAPKFSSAPDYNTIQQDGQNFYGAYDDHQPWPSFG